MKVVVNIYFSGENGAAKKFAEEMESSGIAEEVRKEKRNLQYEYFLPMTDPETVLLIHSWEEQQAVDIHDAAPKTDKLAVLASKYDLHVKVEKYLVGENGITELNGRFSKI